MCSSVVLDARCGKLRTRLRAFDLRCRVSVAKTPASSCSMSGLSPFVAVKLMRSPS